MKAALPSSAALGVPPPVRADVSRDGARPEGTLEGGARELIHHMDRVMRRLLLTQDMARTDEQFSRPEIGVVNTLGGAGPMTMGELARHLRLPLSTGTRVVDGLVARDVVHRERPEEKRRVVRVALTTKGRAFYRVALASRVAAARTMLRILSAGERRELIRLFRTIATVVASERPR
jgi:DNA-binding MarR family transcriptional regulator